MWYERLTFVSGNHGMTTTTRKLKDSDENLIEWSDTKNLLRAKRSIQARSGLGFNNLRLVSGAD